MEGGKGGNEWWYVCTVALYVIMSGCVCTDMYAHWQGVECRSTEEAPAVVGCNTPQCYGNKIR